jgi:cell division septation protein DedD
MRWTLAVLIRSLSLVLPALVFSAIPWDRSLAATDYGIQVGAYQDLDHAVERVNYLKRLGYGAFYHYETVKGKGKWYRVYIARFPTREQAREEARVLQDLKLIDDYDIRRLKGGTSTPAKPEQEPETPPAKPRTATQPQKTSPPAAERGVVFLLHVSSYKEQAHAVEEAQKLENAGQKAFYVEEDLASGHWYRVYIGQYETEKAAREAGARLKEQGLISYFKPLEIDRETLSGSP